MKHWATHLIGLPWKPGAEGPRAFDCWGLVRYVFRLRFGIEMPDVQRGDFVETNAGAIFEAATVSGWRHVPDAEPEADDIILMRREVDGKRHVGVMIASSQGLRLLHSDGHLTSRGPVGSVVSVPLKTATEDGYGDFEVWRKVP